ncbi:hypothetical protein [Nibricoccus sp. IMCC34717]|uniref:hypothetical protein n=1 Tax=Nibricoccus sp. IMCC34717 TaxID=3034021 RepID=UPI00384B8CB1
MRRFATLFWLVLTEVPGWPNAPWPHRLRRLLPVLVPVIALISLAAWLYAIHLPQRNREAAAAAPLLALEAEVSSLALKISDSQASTLAATAAAARNRLVNDVDQRQRLLATLQQQATAAGWSVTFQAGDTPVVLNSRHFGSTSVRAVFKPAPENQRPLASLLTFLEGLTQSPKRIDLIRLSIRADELGWHSVEAGLLLAVPNPNEKVAQ